MLRQSSRGLIGFPFLHEVIIQLSSSKLYDFNTHASKLLPGPKLLPKAPKPFLAKRADTKLSEKLINYWLRLGRLGKHRAETRGPRRMEQVGPQLTALDPLLKGPPLLACSRLQGQGS